jgi:hypothetical protein
MAGAGIVLRNAATVLSDAIVDFYVHGCSPFRVVIFFAQYIQNVLRCTNNELAVLMKFVLGSWGGFCCGAM